jgi:hypothetical protein
MFIVQEKIYTYSEDFFMIAFFTLRAGDVSTTILVAGSGSHQLVAWCPPR